MKHKFIVLALVALAMVCASSTYAQSDRGSITGTVSDPNGAVVVGAKVTATNLDTGEVREATTTSEGNYTLQELPADEYRISVEAQGFKTTTIENLKVAVQTTRSLDLTLEIGQITDVVTVTNDSAPAIQTDTPVRQTNVTERQVKELPLQVTSESGGRTPLSFIFLDSNVSSSGTIGGQESGSNANRFRVSGGQALGTEILIDGGSSRRAQNGTAFTEISPGPNALQEFTLSTSTYSAEYGNSSGGIVNFTIKSGGNEFHGEAYELHRNDALNANSWFNNATGTPRRRDLQHDFGFNIGGPVYLPRFGEGSGSPVISLKNRTFFFFNYEGYRFNQSETATISVPTELMRQGNFSELFTDPAVLAQIPGGVQLYAPMSGFDADGNPIPAPPGSRIPIPGNRIDLFTLGGRSIIDPAGQNLLLLYPRPQRPGVVGNYTSTAIVPTTMNNAVFKIDQVITDMQRLSFSYSYRKSDTIGSCCGGAGRFPRFPDPLASWGTADQVVSAHIFRLQHDWTLSPTVVNHFGAGFNHSENFLQSPGIGAADPFALGIPQGSVLGGALPVVEMPGYGFTDVRRYEGFGGAWVNNSPFSDNLAQLSDFVAWVRGRHTLRMGGEVRWQQFNTREVRAPAGWFGFRAPQTGNSNPEVPNQGWPIASLITGTTDWAFNANKTVDPGWRYFYPGVFVQDDIKLTQRLTLNVGVRYEINYPRTESRNRYRSFDPDVINPVVGRRGALVSANGQGALKAQYEGLAKPDYSNIGPRVGFAYAINDRTVVRGGYGIYYSPIIFGFAGDVATGQGIEGYNTDGLYRNFDQTSNFFLSSFPALPTGDPNSQFIAGEDISYINKNYKSGRTQQWSLDVQRELPANFVASAGYIGSRGTRLRSDIGRPNALPLAALKLGHPLLSKRFNDVTAVERAFAQSLGFTIPATNDAVYPGFNGGCPEPICSVAQSLRPFPQYGRINNILESEGQSWYNALQLKLGRRFSQGIQFDVAYTFSRLTGTAAEDLYGGSPLNAPQNPYERTRAVSPNSTPHVLVFNYILEMPFGKGKRYFNRGGAVDKLLGGWQIGGIHRYQSGVPLVVVTTASTGWLNLVGFTGFRGANLRPNVTGQPILSADPTGLRPNILNREAFSQPTNFEAAPTTDVTDPAYAAYYSDPTRFFGTASPVFDDVRILPFLSENFSILKKTHLSETVVFEIRGEFFNLFNRHTYTQPNGNFGDAGGFGFSEAAGNPRTIQVGARLIF
jgi:hypothetical protein